MCIAVYDTEGILMGIYLESDIRGINSYDSIKDMDTIKVFIWDRDMKPLTAVIN